MIPGWPYSLVAALEPGRTSWTLPLDAVRLGPADDATEVTAAQVREVVERIIEAGHWHAGDPDVLVVFDSGYDLTRLAWLLADLPVEIMGRLRSDRVMYFPAPPRPARPAGTGGRPPRHGAALKLSDPQTWAVPSVTTSTQTARYGTARAMAWGRLHQQLASRGGWEGHDGPLPVIEGTLIRLAVDHLPGDRSPEPLWLWSSRAQTSTAEVDRTWQAFLRRFDLEHTFRFLKQVLGWTRPKLRDPAAADRWTWIVIAGYAQLYLARPLAADIRLPWQRPCPPGRLTPARVRRGFRNIRQALPDLASAPKPGKPGPGRPPGSRNRHPATRHDVGKTVKRDQPTKKAAGRRVK
jgi:DDE superfamily endonuclease